MKPIPCCGCSPTCPSSTGWRPSPSPAGRRGAVYQAVESLEAEGLAVSLPHASELTPATRRYCLTGMGLRRLAREEEREGGRAAPQPTRLEPVATAPHGAAGRRGRRLPPRLRHIDPGPPPPLPLVPRHADGRRRRAPRRARDRRRPAGTGHRPHGLLQAALASQGGDAARRHAPAHARRGAAAPRPQAAGRSAVHRLRRPGEGRRLRRGRCVRLANALRRGAPRPSHRPRPHRAARPVARRGAAGAGIPARRPRRRGRGGLDVARPAEARREARPRPDRRLALADPRPPGRADGAEAVEALRDRRAADRPGPRAGLPRRGAAASPSPTGGWLRWPAETGPPWAGPGSGGAPPP